MFKATWSKLTGCWCRKQRVLVILLPCILVWTFYIVSEYEFEFDGSSFLRLDNLDDEFTAGYLVWNSKCHMLSKDPMDRSIRRFVKRKKFVTCSSEPLMSHVSRDSTNGSIYVAIVEKIAKSHGNPTCCWAPIVRPVPARPPEGEWDTKISVGKCEDFKKRVWVPQDVDIVMITCRRGKTRVYENVHAIVNPLKVKKRLDQARSLENASEAQTTSRKLSVLVLGMDSVSRLNFRRSMPKTKHFLDTTDWISLDGYNKMGENTFPNLMAILTGQNNTMSYAKCKPTEAFGMDRCPMLWYNFRNASYVTAYGEDTLALSTFNYHKVGFVEPPTDYYLRPYIAATDKLVDTKKYHDAIHYCTGPESSVDRIFNYAVDFARTFRNTPYFGFFWTNAATHDDSNGASSMDNRMLEIFQIMERDGIFNDTIIIFLSDHGMRWGDLRNTFIGWYEERLPLFYIRLPEWFREEEPQAYDALRLNQRRLTSPYDLYETLRDVLTRGGGNAESSSGCETCQTLLRPVPIERGCDDVGVTPHWCTCTAFEASSTTDKIASRGTKMFLEHVENIIDRYKDNKGKRLCSRLKLKKIYRVDRILNVRHNANATNFTLGGYFYMIEVTPGGAKYEFTLRYREGDNFTVADDEINRINSYAEDSRCLDYGSKEYCYCAG